MSEETKKIIETVMNGHLPPLANVTASVKEPNRDLSNAVIELDYWRNKAKELEKELKTLKEQGGKREKQ